MNYTKSTEYFGQYRGVGWIIRATENSSYPRYGGHKINWCHYITLNLNQLPEDVREEFWLAPKMAEWSKKRKHVTYDYYGSVISDLDWHIGCTYYDKISNVDSLERIIKAGCDYQHYWDEGKEYVFEDVLAEAKLTINSLHDNFDVGVLCWYGACDKKFHLETSGQYNDEEKSSFYCDGCIEHRKNELEKQKIAK